MLNFHRPHSLEQAVGIFQACDNPAYIAGGQSLIVGIRLGLADFSDLIDLSGIPDLRQINCSDNELTIGALCTHADIADSSIVQKNIPALARLAAEIADMHIRNRGTIGGSLGHCDPAADYSAAILGLGATIFTDQRSIRSAEFFTGTFAKSLNAGEIIKEIRLPVPQKASYQRFCQSASRFPLVGVFAVLLPDRNIRFGVTGLLNYPRAIVKSEQEIKFNQDDINADIHAAADYREQLFKVLTQRAIDELGNSL